MHARQNWLCRYSKTSAEDERTNRMKYVPEGLNNRANRLSFIKKGLLAAGTATAGVGLLANAKEDGGKLNKGDAAILRFLAAAEIIETDVWQQYNELAGIQDSEVPGGSGNAPFTAAVKVLDGDMDQYIHDNTEDELTHFTFINAYLASRGVDTVNL